MMRIYMMVRKLFYFFLFNYIHFLFVRFTIFLQDMFDLCNRNNREKFREKEIAGKKQSKCSQVKTYLPNGWCIIVLQADGR